MVLPKLKLLSRIISAAAAASSSSSARSLTTLSSSSSVLRRSTATSSLIQSPWSIVQQRGAKVHGSDVKPGNVIERKGRLYEVIKADHNQQGRGSAMIQAELRDVESGNETNVRFNTDESIEKIFVEEKQFTCICTIDDEVALKDLDTFEQVDVQGVLCGRSLPVSLRYHPALSCSFRIPHRKVQEKLLNVRGFAATAGSKTDSEDEDTENGEENRKPAADPKEVESVCKVIDELFELDRNMEAVLDECDVNVTHDLVVEVLNRFRHARKPALRFFSWAGRKPGFTHDSRTYNKMMEILGKTRQFETMVSMLEEMGEKGLLTMETFSTAIKAFAASKERKKAVGVFELMKKYKYKVGAETINCLLDALGQAKLGKEAYNLFEKLKERVTPDLRTYTVLLNGWCRVRNLVEAGRIWNEMVELGLNPDIIAHNTMIEGLIRCQKRSDAIKLFMVMKSKGPNPNVRSFTILIRDFCKQGMMREAVEYFDEMVELGFQPDMAVYTCLITGFGNQRRMDMVYGLLKAMKVKGCPPDGKTYNALIKLMTNRKMPDDAVTIYKKMIQNGIEPTIHSYNMMMKSYFQIRNYEMGEAVWGEMRQKGCCPDENSYSVVIAGLISNGRSEESCRYLEEMLAKGMKAPQLDYNKFAADFSRAGRPDILEELAKKMKFSGKFEVANVFSRWSEMMKKRVKRRDRFCRMNHS